MERSWLPAIIIGGGAIVMVGVFVAFGGGTPPGAADAGVYQPIPTTAGTDAAPVVTFDAALPPPAPVVSAPSALAVVDAAPSPASEDAAPPVEGPAATIRARIAQLKREIAQLEGEGKQAEAAQKKLLLDRMQAKLDTVQNGM